MSDNDKLARGGESAKYDNGTLKVSQEKWDEIWAEEPKKKPDQQAEKKAE